MGDRLREVKPGYFVVERSPADRKHLEKVRAKVLSADSCCAPTPPEEKEKGSREKQERA